MDLKSALDEAEKAIKLQKQEGMTSTSTILRVLLRSIKSKIKTRDAKAKGWKKSDSESLEEKDIDNKKVNSIMQSLLKRKETL